MVPRPSLERLVLQVEEVRRLARGARRAGFFRALWRPRSVASWLWVLVWVGLGAWALWEGWQAGFEPYATAVRMLIAMAFGVSAVGLGLPVHVILAWWTRGPERAETEARGRFELAALDLEQALCDADLRWAGWSMPLDEAPVELLVADLADLEARLGLEVITGVGHPGGDDAEVPPARPDRPARE